MPATIFAGTKVKTLKSTLSLNGGPEISQVSTNPNLGAGLAAPLGSLALNSSNGIVFSKSGPANTDWGAINQAGNLPVGSIIAFSGGYFTGANNTGSWTDVLGNTIGTVNSYLSGSGFLVCDGSAPQDPASPIFDVPGKFLPNLTDSRFLQGSTAAGTIGGSNTATTQFNSGSIQATGWAGTASKKDWETDQIAHGHGTSGYIRSWANTSNNWHGVQNAGIPAWTSNSISSGTAVAAASYTNGQVVVMTNPNASVAWSVGSTASITVSSNPSFNPNSLNASVQSVDNRPSYFNVFYIMRIK